jgi:hypothetical protein
VRQAEIETRRIAGDLVWTPPTQMSTGKYPLEELSAVGRNYSAVTDHGINAHEI